MAVLNPNSKIVFYDDVAINIKDVNSACKSNVEAILIPTSARTPPINLETNLYYKYLKAINSPISEYDPQSGIQKEHIDSLQTWATTATGPKHVVFDWDYTLSMCSGIQIYDIPRDSSISSVYEMDLHKRYKPARIYEDMLLYMMGGKERLTMIRQMFAFLKKTRVNVHILTNNPVCNMPFRKAAFRELVYALAKHKSVRIICGGIDKFKLDKGVAMKMMIPACTRRKCKLASKRLRRAKTKKRRVN